MFYRKYTLTYLVALLFINSETSVSKQMPSIKRRVGYPRIKPSTTIPNKAKAAHEDWGESYEINPNIKIYKKESGEAFHDNFKKKTSLPIERKTLSNLQKEDEEYWNNYEKQRNRRAKKKKLEPVKQTEEKKTSQQPKTEEETQPQQSQKNNTLTAHPISDAVMQEMISINKDDAAIMRKAGGFISENKSSYEVKSV